jgi:general secretion pathway protein A
MYDGCFGLNRRPFASAPQIEQFIPTTAIEAARTTLARCIQRGEGAGLVIGPSGTGKTLLCLLLAEQFKRSFQPVLLHSGRLSTRRALFQAILYELGRPYRGLDEGEARLALVDYLMTGEGGLRGMLLLVDEAHTLPLRLLEEIRLLSNLMRGGQPLVRLVLAGGPVLEERFASPKLDSFSQRLSARCYLETLNRSETERYIQSQI